MNGKLVSQRIQRAWYLIMDLITTSIAFFIFNVVRFSLMANWDMKAVRGYLLDTKIILEQIFLPILILGIYWLSGYYNRPFNKSRLQEFNTTFFSAVITSLIIYFTMLINDQLPTRTLNYELLLFLLFSMFFCVYIGRLMLTSITIKRFKQRVWSFNTVIIGNSDDAVNMARCLERKQTSLGVNIVGHLNIEGEKESTKSHKTLTLEQFKKLVENHSIDQLLIVPKKKDSEEKVLMQVNRYFQYGLPVKIAPTSLSFLTSNIHIQDIYAEPFVDVTTPVMKDSDLNLKRVLDVVISSLALLIGAPIFLGVAIAVKLSSKGPVIYSQERIGYRQKPFKIYKFRSMYTDAEANGPQLTDDEDSRITKVGHFLRKYRFDELPQFWNVLKGDMSLVGPRPERAFFIEQIVKEAPYYTLVHQVKPGITSWGMVKFGYAKTIKEMVERTRYDLIYLSNMSVLVDFKILIHTVKTVIMGEGK